MRLDDDPDDLAAGHRNATESIHFWTSDRAATVAIVVVIDLYKTDPYRPQGTRRGGEGEWKGMLAE